MSQDLTKHNIMTKCLCQAVFEKKYTWNILPFAEFAGFFNFMFNDGKGHHKSHISLTVSAISCAEFSC
jgi:hypothetical protein